MKYSLINEEISKRVLYIGFDFTKPKGGIGSVLNTYSTFIHPFKFITTSGGDLKCHTKITYAIKAYAYLTIKLISDKNIKIIHIHSASGTSFWRKAICIYIAKAFNKKIIFHCHGGGFKEFRLKNSKKVDNIIKKCDVIVALSEIWKSYFESIYKLNVVTVRNVIPFPEHKHVKKDNKIHLLFLGLICQNKGIFDLLEVIKNHKEEFNNKLILHIGGNGEVNRLIKYIKENNLDSLISYEGWVDKEKKKYLLNLCDIFILPSYIEGVPISILEAESYKKPIITTNVGGIPSIVTDSESGLFVHPGNSKEIYEAIIKLMNNPILRDSMGNKGYLISNNYLPKSIAKQLTELYISLLKS